MKTTINQKLNAIKAILFLLSILIAPGMGLASTIDTRPSSDFLLYRLSTGSDAAGGTFTADDLNLDSFTLQINNYSDFGGFFRGIVMATDGFGVPSGSLLWESVDVTVPEVSTEFIFNPNVALTIGETYFIGFDTGLYTTTFGGTLELGFAEDVYSDGVKFENLDGIGWTINLDRDIASEIVMSGSSVPEPATMLLFGFGLLGFAGISRRKK